MLALAGDAPVGAVLEGGYDLDALAGSVVETLSALGDGGEPAPVERHPLAERAAATLRSLVAALAANAQFLASTSCG